MPAPGPFPEQKRKQPGIFLRNGLKRDLHSAHDSQHGVPTNRHSIRLACPPF